MAKILLVDDDKLMIKMYKGKFDDDGYEVAVATNGVQGLEKTLEFKPDLILLDIMMPKMNGLQMLAKLKEKEETKKVPVILLTNVGGEDDAERGLELGAVAYLVKAHYDVSDVVKKVKEVLSGYVKEVPKVEVEIKDEGEKEDREVERTKKEVAEAEKMLKKAKKKLENIT